MVMVRRKYIPLFIYCLQQIPSAQGNLGGLYNVLNHAINNIADSVTKAPTSKPTTSIEPSRSPSIVPSISPSTYPTVQPTSQPSVLPSIPPSLSPTLYPTSYPTSSPSAYPTNYPTSTPSGSPSPYPTAKPSYRPTLSPSSMPSTNPTTTPSIIPSSIPSSSPSKSPSSNPSTVSPTIQPSVYVVSINRPQSETAGTGSLKKSYFLSSRVFFILVVVGSVAAISTILFVSVHLIKRTKGTTSKGRKQNDFSDPSHPRHNGSEFDDHPMDQSFANPSTIQSETTSVWKKRIEFDTRTHADDFSEFHLPSVFNGSTIKSEGSWARRCKAPLPLQHENLDDIFGNSEIPNQIVCVNTREE